VRQAKLVASFQGESPYGKGLTTTAYRVLRFWRSVCRRLRLSANANKRDKRTQRPHRLQGMRTFLKRKHRYADNAVGDVFYERKPIQRNRNEKIPEGLSCLGAWHVWREVTGTC